LKTARLLQQAAVQHEALLAMMTDERVREELSQQIAQQRAQAEASRRRPRTDAAARH